MLANTRQSWRCGSHSMDSGFRVLDSSLFQWNLDSRFHSLVGYLISILDSKALDSGFHRNNFPGFRILQAKIFQTPESGYQSNIFWPVHAYLIKQWEIYFSSNVRFYNMMDRSNFWSMQLFQTGPHFKLEEVWFWKGIFPSWHNRLNTNVRGSGKLNEAWKGIFYSLN